MAKGRKPKKAAKPRQKKALATAPPVRAGESVLEQLLSRVRSDPHAVEPALGLGEYYFRNNGHNEILNAVSHLEESYPFDNEKHRQLYDRLVVFGYLYQHRLIEAESFLARGLEQSPQALDFHYAAAYKHAALREHDSTLAACERYLQLFDRAVTEPHGTHFTATGGHRSQLLNFMATAYRESGQRDQALEAYEQSINADPGNHLPYLNLANLFIRQRQWSKAKEKIDRGLRQCRQVQELRVLLETSHRKATISACMIVKDEEEVLDRCLQSIRDWVDEIIVVDTGSTDRTVDIARTYGANVYHQPWEGDFSKHRNYSLEQATCDWIFVIDADEEVYREDIPAIQQVLHEGSHKLVSVNIINVYADDEASSTFLPSDRFFKRELNLHYEGIVHNQLRVHGDVRALRTGIRIKHYGYGLSPERMRQKKARTVALLEEQLAQNPDDAFARFNLAQQLRSGEEGFPKENATAIIEHAGRAVDLTDPANNREKHIHLMSLDQLAWTYFYLEEYQKATKYCRRAIELKPDYLDPLLLAGHISCRLERYDEAIQNYRKYLDVQAAYDPAREQVNIIFFHVESAATAHCALAMINQLRGNIPEAKRQYQETLALNPGYQEANLNLGQILLAEDRPEEAEHCFLRQLERSDQSAAAVQGLAAIYLQRGQKDKAERYLKLALELEPDDAVTLIKLGRLQIQSGCSEEAACFLEKAAAMGGVDAARQKDLADAFYSLGRYDRAASIYLGLVNEGRADAEVYNDLGNCYYKQDDLTAAESAYVKALDGSRPFYAAYRNLGLTRARLEKHAEAVWALERFVEAEPGEHRFLQIIGDLYTKLGDFESALTWYEKYLTLHPQDLTALFGLSESYLLMGHRDSALMGYRRILQIDPAFEPAQQRILQLADRAARITV
jgi:tetratricopeptide (TPR) repeat protein